MKKFIATFALVAVLCGSLVGCGDDKKNNKPAANTANTANTATK